MTLRNTDTHYGAIAKSLHWLIALIIFGLIPLGLYMVQMPYGPEKLDAYAWHKSFGLLVLWLAGFRILWRFWSQPPDELDTHAPWEQFLAKGAHFLLYTAMIGMPVSGWIMSSAGEFPVPFFGIEMPDLAVKDPDLFSQMRFVHTTLAYILIGVIGMHVAGAFKHHIIDRDSTLKRMTADGTGCVIPAMLILLLAAFFIGTGYLVFNQSMPSAPASESFQEDLNLSSAASIEGDSLWTINSRKSELEFKAAMYGSEFTGQFKNFGGTINFDPDNLEESYAEIIIDMTSVETGNDERDEQILTSDWFDVAQYPKATFKTLQFERAAGNNYVAVGNLSIKNVTLPVSLPFTLEIKDKGDQKTAQVSGNLQLNRHEFNIGEGEWSTGATVSEGVRVTVSLTASQEN